MLRNGFPLIARQVIFLISVDSTTVNDLEDIVNIQETKGGGEGKVREKEKRNSKRRDKRRRMK